MWHKAIHGHVESRDIQMETLQICDLSKIALIYVRSVVFDRE